MEHGALGWTRDLQEQSRCEQTLTTILRTLGNSQDELLALMAEGREWPLERAIDDGLSV